MNDLSFYIYVVAAVVGILFAAALAYAPMKLYSIDRELKRLNELQTTHTKLLAAIANSVDPVREDR